MKIWTTAFFLGLALQATLGRAAPSLEFMEKFALDDEREAALAELVPGTDDYFYYLALHRQLLGDSKAFDEMLSQWFKQRNGSWNEQMLELRRRQILLNFDKDPEKTWTFLIDDEFHLQFNHRAKSAQVSPDYPREIDPRRYGMDSFLSRAMARPHPVGEFTDAGLELAARQKLDGDERRNLLARLTRSDIPNLVDMIIADLHFKDSRGFGHHGIHNLLTLAQLETLAQREPALLDNAQYINERLARMQPGEEVDIENDVHAAIAFYTQLWDFLKNISPQHNSHKALVLYRLLDAERHTGNYDDIKFRQYLALPRNMYYVEANLRKQWQDQRTVWVNTEHQLPMSVAVEPIRQEEPLVRDFLIRLLKEAANPTAYSPFFEARWLDAIFAESKILNGVGAPEQWASKLPPDQYRAIRERIELNFALQNPRQFRPGENVVLDVDTKHIDKLLIKVFEIQAFNYYKQNRAAVNQAIDLDGMERTLTFDTPASQRVRRNLAFPEIDQRGVYVVELIGNGVSSRALVYVGKLEYLTVPTAYGQAVAVLNENGERVKDARLWMAGTEYTPDDAGLLLLPYSNAEKVEFVILRLGLFSSPEQLRHLGEPYTFSAGIFVEPQALGRLRTSTLVLRPDLRVNSIPLDPALLEDVKVTLRTSDAKGTPIEREFKPAFTRDREWVTEFFVPDALRELSVTVTARIKQQRDL
ncbi:MAG: hypothetical protein O3C57_04760, partial [Verrucomicrobia bacterium]|nr:hypothetical protein [Verrucomicrobiota bacterium]